MGAKVVVLAVESLPSMQGRCGFVSQYYINWVLWYISNLCIQELETGRVEIQTT